MIVNCSINKYTLAEENADCGVEDAPTFNQSAMTMTEGSVMVLSSSLVALFFSSL